MEERNLKIEKLKSKLRKRHSSAKQLAKIYRHKEHRLSMEVIGRGHAAVPRDVKGLVDSTDSLSPESHLDGADWQAPAAVSRLAGAGGPSSPSSSE